MKIKQILKGYSEAITMNYPNGVGYTDRGLNWMDCNRKGIVSAVIEAELIAEGHENSSVGAFISNEAHKFATSHRFPTTSSFEEATAAFIKQW